MRLRSRPVRSQLYLPVLRLGLQDQDWAYVLFAGTLGYSIPYLLGLKFWGIPAELWVAILALLLSIGFLNLVRVGRRPNWLRFRIQGYVRGKVSRRRLPGETSTPWVY